MPRTIPSAVPVRDFPAKRERYPSKSKARTSTALQKEQLPEKRTKAARSSPAEKASPIRNPTVVPTVSVVLPVYNGGDYLSVAIESVLEQTLTDLELLIFDDASTDNSAAIIKEYADRDPRVVFSQNSRNLGVGDTLRRAFRSANGRYICQIGQDDILSHNLLEVLTAACAKTGAAAVFPGVVYIDAAGCRQNADVFRLDRLAQGTRWDLFAQLLSGNFLCAPGSIVNSGMVKSEFLGCRNDRLQDWELWLNLLLDGELVLVPETSVFYRLHEANFSREGYRVTQGKFEFLSVLLRTLFTERFKLFLLGAADSVAFVTSVFSELSFASAWCPALETINLALYETVSLYLSEATRDKVCLPAPSEGYFHAGLFRRVLAADGAHSSRLSLLVGKALKISAKARTIASFPLFQPTDFAISGGIDISRSILLIGTDELDLLISGGPTVQLAVAEGRVILLCEFYLLSHFRQLYSHFLILDEAALEPEEQLYRTLTEFLEDRLRHLLSHPHLVSGAHSAAQRLNVRFLEAEDSGPVGIVTLLGEELQSNQVTFQRGSRVLQTRRIDEHAATFAVEDLPKAGTFRIDFGGHFPAPSAVILNSTIWIAAHPTLNAGVAGVVLRRLAAAERRTATPATVPDVPFGAWPENDVREFQNTGDLHSRVERIRTASVVEASAVRELRTSLIHEEVAATYRSGLGLPDFEPVLGGNVMSGRFLHFRRRTAQCFAFQGAIDSIRRAQNSLIVVTGWITTPSAETTLFILESGGKVLAHGFPRIERMDVAGELGVSSLCGFSVSFPLTPDFAISREIRLYGVQPDRQLAPVASQIFDPADSLINQFRIDPECGKGCVDHLFNSDEGVALSGWAFANQGGKYAPVIAILVCIGKDIVSSFPTISTRHDVSEVFKIPKTLRMSFEKYISFRDLPSAAGCSGRMMLYGAVADGRAFPLDVSWAPELPVLGLHDAPLAIEKVKILTRVEEGA